MFVKNVKEWLKTARPKCKSKHDGYFFQFLYLSGKYKSCLYDEYLGMTYEDIENLRDFLYMKEKGWNVEQ